jgi:hypothetical protein
MFTSVTFVRVLHAGQKSCVDRRAEKRETIAVIFAFDSSCVVVLQNEIAKKRHVFNIETHIFGS